MIYLDTGALPFNRLIWIQFDDFIFDQLRNLILHASETVHLRNDFTDNLKAADGPGQWSDSFAVTTIL